VYPRSGEPCKSTPHWSCPKWPGRRILPLPKWYASRKSITSCTSRAIWRNQKPQTASRIRAEDC
jgi:hypothetical protein